MQRIPVEGFLAPGSAPAAVEHSKTLRLDLTPWLLPGDDLERARFTSVLAVPMMGRTGADGALLLRGMRAEDGQRCRVWRRCCRAPTICCPSKCSSRACRPRAARPCSLKSSSTPKSFAGLGQLAGNVTQQLNSPLTVILGYASLLEDSSALDAQDRKAVESIVAEARRIRSTLESLSRVSRAHADQPAAISVSELLADMEQLYRPSSCSAPSSSRSMSRRACRAFCAVRSSCARPSCIACSMPSALSNASSCCRRANEPKTIRLEAASEGNLVQISVSHSGPGFLQPERAFDPFVPARPGGETAGMGLSLCATILRDQNGRASAVNLEPRGAAIILELQAA